MTDKWAGSTWDRNYCRGPGSNSKVAVQRANH